MAEDDNPTARQRAEALTREAYKTATEHALGTVYALEALTVAVLDVADAVRATTPPRKGPVLPTPPSKPTGITPCKTCGHVMDMHHEEAGACRSASCPCTWFAAVTDG